MAISKPLNPISFTSGTSRRCDRSNFAVHANALTPSFIADLPIFISEFLIRKVALHRLNAPEGMEKPVS